MDVVWIQREGELYTAEHDGHGEEVPEPLIMNYYNDFDKHACAWLRELIKAGIIPPGDVDERPIQEIKPHELSGYTQCHLFAGVGGWPIALGLAGWGADRPVWSGSCPCQPFSVAGAGGGVEDERHLWPEFLRLIATCKPDIVFGEQVASRAGREWLSSVRLDLENIELCRVFYENMHEVQEKAAEGKLPEILWSINRRIKAALQGVPKKIRTEMERCEQRAACGDKGKEISQGKKVPFRIRCCEQGNAVGNASETEMLEKENSIRLRPTHCGDRKKNTKKEVRNDRGGIRYVQRRNQMELAFFRQDSADERICLFKHSGCLFRNECRSWQLGGGSTAQNYECMAGKEIADDKRSITNAFREMLESKLGREWLSGVRLDLEEMGYAVGAADLCAASVGAPHIRQRLFWVADAMRSGRPARWAESRTGQASWDGERRRMGNTESDDREVLLQQRRQGKEGIDTGWSGECSGLVDADSQRLQGFPNKCVDEERWNFEERPVGLSSRSFWDDSIWIPCGDGKARRIKPGLEPLVDGLHGRASLLRGYGNAIVPQIASEFVRAFMELEVG